MLQVPGQQPPAPLGVAWSCWPPREEPARCHSNSSRTPASLLNNLLSRGSGCFCCFGLGQGWGRGLAALLPALRSLGMLRHRGAAQRCFRFRSLTLVPNKKNSKRYRAASDFTFPEDASTLSRMSGTWDIPSVTRVAWSQLLKLSHRLESGTISGVPSQHPFRRARQGESGGAKNPQYCVSNKLRNFFDFHDVHMAVNFNVRLWFLAEPTVCMYVWKQAKQMHFVFKFIQLHTFLCCLFEN